MQAFNQRSAQFALDLDQDERRGIAGRECNQSLFRATPAPGGQFKAISA
jgi:hypothetical protein